MQPLSPGTVLNARYRIVRLIGRGGMGAVYEGADTRLQTTVAIKQITVDGGQAAGAFEQEARLLAGLRHPALPVVIDHFTDRAGQFLVMQFIEGEDLEKTLAARGPLSNDDLLRCARALLEALQYLHSQSPPVVHRDIKPANVRRTPRGEFVLIDFGLAKGGREGDTRVDGARTVFGYTPGYAPPEQVAGSGTDIRSDLFSLGATLHHLATGSSPPRVERRIEAMRAGQGDPLNAGGTSLLGWATRKAMSLDPKDRFQTAEEMLRAIDWSADLKSADADDQQAARTDRRVDAALPSHTEVGRQVDLLAQVRFSDSPLLGLEDFPERRRPAGIEQSSETFTVTYPRDPSTGTVLAARLRLKVTAPDFEISGVAERLIEVPPNDFSPRVSFLLTPRHAGTCRVNLDVYTAEDLYLGTVPIDAEGVGGEQHEPQLRVANLVLQLLAERAAIADATGELDLRRFIEEERTRRAGASRADAIAGIDAIGAVLRPVDEYVRLGEAAKAAPPEAAPQNIASSRRQGRVRPVTVIASLAVVVLIAGTVLPRWSASDPPELAPAAAITSAKTAAPPDTRASESVSAPPSPAAPSPIAATRPAPPAATDMRALFAAIDEYEQQFNSRVRAILASGDLPPGAHRFLKCTDPDSKQIRVRLIDPVNAQATCRYTASGEATAETRDLNLQRTSSGWRVVSPALPK